MPGEVTLQGMKIPSCPAEVGGRLRVIQRKKLNGQLRSVRRLNPSPASRLEKLLDTRMPEALDHVLSVAHHASGGKEASHSVCPCSFR
jgi:hypothetical protein